MTNDGWFEFIYPSVARHDLRNCRGRHKTSLRHEICTDALLAEISLFCNVTCRLNFYWLGAYRVSVGFRKPVSPQLCLILGRVSSFILLCRE